MTSDRPDPFATIEPESRIERLVLQYLRWGLRHPHLMTLLVVAITVLLFVVLWQLFTLIVAVVVVAGVLIGMTVYRLSLREAARRGVESQGRHG